MDEPITLALCEQSAILLRPNVTYLFEVVPGCQKCEDILATLNQ